MDNGTTPRGSGYSADTEILTRSGWVTFDRLTYLDEVATRSPDGVFEWQHPERVTWRLYDGDMVQFRSRTINLLVAADTKISYFYPRRTTIDGKRVYLGVEKSGQRTRPAMELIGHKVPLIATSTWKPEKPARQVLLKSTPVRLGGKRNTGKPPLEFTASADDFAAFMGMYLAEGNLGPGRNGNYEIWIWQKNQGRGFREFQGLLNRLLGREVPWLKHGCWRFNNKALYEYLKTCGGYAWTKQVPRDVLDLPSESLELFWRYYCLGDGTVMNTGSDRKPLDVISTTSKAMAGEIQEVVQKLGTWSLIQCVDRSKYPSSIGARTCRMCYRLVRRAGTVAYATSVERVPFAGMIGSASVDGRALYVRRNNRPVWSG